MKLSIIIVNYNSKKSLLYCLSSINRFLYSNSELKKDFEVIIVNNENHPLQLPIRYPFVNAKIIEVGKNVGFGVAANLGTIMAQGKYFLFLNPDTIFLDQSLPQALSYLEKHPSVGALGLSVINKRRKAPENWSCGKKTTWGSILFRNTINKPWNKKVPQRVDWSSAAGLIVRKEAFKKIKGFDKKFFMYFEDQDLCLRLKKADFQIIHFPQSKILHLNGQSWHNEKEQKRQYRKSQLYFFKKHNTPVGYLTLKSIYKIISGFPF
jgi:GT2 family glycosyltransferase